MGKGAKERVVPIGRKARRAVQFAPSLST